jgi:glycosyltransferase involved in cell wall biosynthesis
VLDLARAFRARGVPVAVATLLDGPLATELASHGVPVHRLGMRRGVANPRAVLGLARVVRAFRPDVVHSHMVHANLLTRLTRVIAPMPLLVCTAHNIDEEGRLRELAYRLTDPLCEVTTNVSEAATRRYAERRLASPGRLRHVPNGLVLARHATDLATRERVRRALEVGAADFLWLFVGRLDVQKDPGTLLRGFAAHRAAHPRSRLALVGVGPLRASAERLAADLPLAGGVTFLGLRDDVAALMQAADAFVLASRWEGLPMVLLEAAGAGLPIVATDVGGNGEIVRHGETGCLVPAADPQALAAAMDAIAALDPAARHRLGEAGRRVVMERYDLEHVADEWLRLYAGAARAPTSTVAS